jgi:hypothetical protein
MKSQYRNYKYRQTPIGKKKKKKLNQKRYLIQDDNEVQEVMNSEGEKPGGNIFLKHLWFLFKVLFFYSRKPGRISRKNHKNKKKKRIRDSAP